MSTKEEVLAGVTDADRQELTAALKAWSDAGVADAKIPLGYDVEGDGKADAWALDANGQLTLIDVDDIEQTVAMSDGSGVEQGGNGGAE